MRGLLAVECLYHQIVAGRKTQTRRSGGLDEVNIHPDNWEITGHTGDENQLEVVDFCDYMDTQRNIYLKPRYKIGEVLYLKEPTFLMTSWVAEKEWLIYKYDSGLDNDARKNIKWSNKLFMPEVDARAFIQITGIRCERLMDISDEDCIWEGIGCVALPGQAMVTFTDYLCKGLQNHTVNAKESFLSLYKFANKVKEVENTWCWVYEFTYLKDYQHGH